jgi:hypothetical protein
MIEIGDLVSTKRAMFFVEATHPETDDDIEVFLPRWHTLAVCGVDNKEGTVDVKLPDGYVATLASDDVES